MVQWIVETHMFHYDRTMIRNCQIFIMLQSMSFSSFSVCVSLAPLDEQPEQFSLFFDTFLNISTHRHERKSAILLIFSFSKSFFKYFCFFWAKKIIFLKKAFCKIKFLILTMIKKFCFSLAHKIVDQKSFCTKIFVWRKNYFCWMNGISWELCERKEMRFVEWKRIERLSSTGHWDTNVNP